MTERETREHGGAAGQKETDDYIRETAGRSPAQEIEHAVAGLGAISQAEFDSLKANLS